MEIKRRVRTSDRILYKRCRRKFHLQSETRLHLESTAATPIQFWLGSGIHFALEDYHGHNKFGNPHAAFDAYANATYPDGLNSEQLHENFELGHGMLDNYLEWLPGLRGFETLWIDGQPMCEVRLLIPMVDPLTGLEFEYSATIDRILKDEHGRLWILDYKTAKTINTEKLPLDTQITAYHWAIWKQYGIEVEGMVYIQMLKSVPDAPKELKNGGLSKAKNQSTSYSKYRQALIDRFGGIPAEYKEILAELKAQRGFLDNKYIKVDFVRRNTSQITAEEKKIYAEAREMLDPGLPLYPNPTKDCSWDCPFKQVCVAMDDGSDYKGILRDNFRKQHPSDESWRERLVWPSIAYTGNAEIDNATAEEMLL